MNQPAEPLDASGGRRLREFLVWITPVAFTFAALFGVVFAVYGTPMIGVSALLALADGCLLLAASRLAGQGRARSAALLVASGLLLVDVAVAAIAPFSPPILVILPLLAAAIAMTYMEGRALRWLALLCWLATVLVTVMAEFALTTPALPSWLWFSLRLLLVMAAAATSLLMLLHFRAEQLAILARLRAANAALGENEARYHAISDLTTDSIYSLAIDARGQATLEWISDSFGAMTGYAAGELGGLSGWLACMHPHDRAGAVAHFEIVKGGQIDVFEYRVVTKAGETLWLRDYARPIWDAERSRVARILGASQNITSQKRAEQTLQRGYARLRVVYELSDALSRARAIEEIYAAALDGIARGLRVDHAAILLFDAAGVARFAAWRNLSAEYRGAVEGHSPWPAGALDPQPVLVPDTANDTSLAHLFPAIQREGIVSLGFFPLVGSAGLIGKFMIYCDQPYPFADEEIRLAQTIASHIAFAIERERAEQELRENEARFHSLARISPVGIFRADRAGVCLYANERWCQITGLSSADALGTLWTSALHPHDRERAAGEWRESLRLDAPLQSEYRLLSSEGAIAWVFVQLVAEQDEAGAVVGYVGTVTDVTSRKQAEDAQRALERKMLETQKLESLGVLAGGIAHDFNNLLTAVLGNAGLALAELPPNAPVRSTIEQIERAAERAAELTRQMLAYVGKGQRVIRRIDLNALIRETTSLLAASISKKVDLRYHLTPGLPPIDADETQIRQVVMNLVVNASEAIGDREGAVDVMTRRVPGAAVDFAAMLFAPEQPAAEYVALEVRDIGCGMDGETLARIFDPFFTTKFTGRGLGLAAVRGIVRGHHGALDVRSTPEQGTTFTILVPCAPVDEHAAHAPERPTAPARASEPAGGAVLVIDDELGVRMVAGRVLERLGFSVLLAEDGRAGVELFRQRASSIKWVLCDLTMPHMSGDQVFEELRRERPDVRIVLMSGYSAAEAERRFSGGAIFGFLQKPFTPQDLRRVALLAEEPRAP